MSDVRGRRRAGVKAGVVAVAELGPAVGVVQVDDDVVGIEKHDQVLREIGERIDPQIGIAQQHGAGLGDCEGPADHREVDIRQLRGRAHTGEITVARDLRHGRAHDFRACDLRPHRRQYVARGRRVDKHPAHALQTVLERGKERRRRVVVEQGNLGQRPVQARPVGADGGQDVVAAAHALLPRFA
jgi:hypothetical protein